MPRPSFHFGELMERLLREKMVDKLVCQLVLLLPAAVIVLAYFGFLGSSVVRGLAAYYAPAATEASIYLLMLLVLLLRPRGLFGERIAKFE